jgi:hypothetical protein
MLFMKAGSSEARQFHQQYNELVYPLGGSAASAAPPTIKKKNWCARDEKSRPHCCTDSKQVPLIQGTDRKTARAESAQFQTGFSAETLKRHFLPLRFP